MIFSFDCDIIILRNCIFCLACQVGNYLFVCGLKIKKIYDNKNIDTYIRKRNIKNEEFYNNLEQYDILLSGALKDKDVLSINKVILSSYEEMVLKS